MDEREKQNQNIDKGIMKTEICHGAVIRRGLKVNFVFNFLSQVLSLILPLITAPYVARVLHEEGIGQFSYASSIITYFVLFANLGFDVYGQRQIARHQDDFEAKSKVFWEVVLLRAIFTGIAMSILFCILFTIGFGEKYNVLILISSISIVGVTVDISFLYRGDEDFVPLAVRTVFIKLVMIALIFIFVKSQSDLWIYALCSTAVGVISNITLWLSLSKRVVHVKHSLSFRRHIKPTIMIFLPYVAVTIYSVFDKTMIGLLAKNPDYANGCYEQAYKINSVALVPIVVISSIMVSRNAHDYKIGNIQQIKSHLYDACNYVFMMSLPIIVGFIVLSDNLSSWFLGEGYVEVPMLMQIMSLRMLMSGLAVVFGDQLFIAIGKEWVSMIAVTIGAVVNLLLNLLFIRSYGSIGAAIATAICETIITMVFMAFVRRWRWLSFRKIMSNCWKYIIAAGIMFVPIFFLQQLLGNGIWQFFIIMLTGAIVYAVALFILRDKFFITNSVNVLNAVKRRIMKPKLSIAADSPQDTINPNGDENINE